MDALREWMESDLDVIMVGTWMLCGNGWSLIWTLSWSAHGCSAEMDGSDLDVIMAGTWMLCRNGWSLIWTSSWSAHGCSAKVQKQQATNNPKNCSHSNKKRRNARKNEVKTALRMLCDSTETATKKRRITRENAVETASAVARQAAA